MPSSAIGDLVIVLVNCVPTPFTVISFRKKGSFNGQGYFEYLIEGDDGRILAAYGDA